PVVVPVHPRTRDRLCQFGLNRVAGKLILTEPLGYIDFLSLTSHARLVLTDSGGLQEESTALGIPCLTLRDNTERPVTVTHGTNVVVGTGTANILAGYRAACRGNASNRRPDPWDGRPAGRISTVIQKFHFGGRPEVVPFDNFQGATRNLLIFAAAIWRVMGISWNALDNLAATMFAITLTAAYMVMRFVMTGWLALLGAIAWGISPMHLANVPH